MPIGKLTIAPIVMADHNAGSEDLLEGTVASQVGRDNARIRKGASWQALVLGWLLLVIGGYATRATIASMQNLIPIGQIQGREGASALVDRSVHFRGIVTGVLEDENARGTRFYTVYLQDLPGSEDGDPLTSDGIAIFVGARRPDLAIGDIVLAGGYVTEFYGLTEIDNNGLTYTVESRNNPLPQPVVLDSPADNALAELYLERFEGMRVSMPPSTVVGPTHSGCGFSVVRRDSGITRVVVRSSEDPSGHIVGALHPSDVDCQGLPAVATGDEIIGLNGPLTYHFDRFKIVYQDGSTLVHYPAEREAPVGPKSGETSQLVVATFNVNNYFDGEGDIGDSAEPRPSPAELALKQAKIVETIARGLNCPDVLALQEVENQTLLSALTAQLADRCGFVYSISHQDSPDERGADVALLSSPAVVLIGQATLRQGCTELDTGIVDSNIDCPTGQQPLHSRPPLQVAFGSEGQSYVVLVNHFKSKRGGAEETAVWRLAQARHLNELVREIESTEAGSLVIVMGDFNDYDDSEVMRAMIAGGVLHDGLRQVPEEERYTYIFDGASQLIDWLLLSPELTERVIDAGILHSNADYPFQADTRADSASLALRSSDHDVPFIVISAGARVGPASTATPSLLADKAAAETQADWDATHDSVEEPAKDPTVSPGDKGIVATRTEPEVRAIAPDKQTNVAADRTGHETSPEAGSLNIALLAIVIGGIILAGGATVVWVATRKRQR